MSHEQPSQPSASGGVDPATVETPSDEALAQRLAETEDDLSTMARECREAREEVELLEQQLSSARSELVEARARLESLRRSLSFEVGQIIGRGLKRPSLDTVMILPRLARRVLFGAGSGSRAQQREGGGAAQAEDPGRELLAPAEVVRRPGRPLVGAVLDTFTWSCLDPDCDLMRVRPDNWRYAFERQRPDFLLVESAWHGNDDAWQYRVASYASPPDRQSLPAMLKWCRAHGVPTLFWNKEDPVHFERFIASARRFDAILTTDADCLPRYRRAAGHDQVLAVPFAAQPEIHHPILEKDRDDRVCFAGSFYADRHDERRIDMESILRPALAFPFDIYDRNHGLSGPQAAKVAFPEEYRGAIRGRLEYAEMVEAYKRHRVFLNVNSVKQSPTMFSRRVFELLACGTPVISSYSRGIVEILGEDAVAIATTEAETTAHLERLLGDDEEWARTSALGLCRVLGGHTYQDRFADALAAIGLPVPAAWAVSRAPSFQVLVPLGAADLAADVEAACESLAAQSLRPGSVTFLSAAEVASTVRERAGALLPGISVRFLPLVPGGEGLAAADDLVAVFEPGAHYGACYLADAAVALRYAPKPLLGRGAFHAGDGGGALRVQNQSAEHRLVARVPGASVVARFGELSGESWRDVLAGEVLDLGDVASICSMHRFNFAPHSIDGEAGRRVDLDWRRG
jgi:spore maturation protein CgeB